MGRGSASALVSWLPGCGEISWEGVGQTVPRRREEEGGERLLSSPNTAVVPLCARHKELPRPLLAERGLGAGGCPAEAGSEPPTPHCIPCRLSAPGVPSPPRSGPPFAPFPPTPPSSGCSLRGKTPASPPRPSNLCPQVREKAPGDSPACPSRSHLCHPCPQRCHPRGTLSSPGCQGPRSTQHRPAGVRARAGTGSEQVRRAGTGRGWAVTSSGGRGRAGGDAQGAGGGGERRKVSSPGSSRGLRSPASSPGGLKHPWGPGEGLGCPRWKPEGQAGGRVWGGRCAVAACEGGHSPSPSCHRWPDTSEPRVKALRRATAGDVTLLGRQQVWRQGTAPRGHGHRGPCDTQVGTSASHRGCGGGMRLLAAAPMPKISPGEEEGPHHTCPRVPGWSFSQREQRSSPEVPKSNLSPPRGWSPQQCLQGVMAGVGTPWGQGAWDIPGPGCRGEVRQALPPALSQHLRVGPARANTLEFLRKMKR